MKQLLQSFETGKVMLEDVPVPSPGRVQIVVSTRASVVSAGTERALISFGRANYLEKARQQPEKVAQVVQKIRTDGLAATVDAVRAKLAQPTKLGYCSAGVVVETGSQVRGFAIGDRVVTNGSHGEFTCVPFTLAAKIPDGVSFEAAAFTPLAAIALQGIRLAGVTLGETVVVYGLGLVGLLTVQILRASGCRVIGVDLDERRLGLARSFGAIAVSGRDDVVSRVLAETRDVGADAVLLTLASESDEPMHQAATMSRQRGRVILVGVTGLKLRRDDFYRKELSFAVSCSYGPGRYDPLYEDAAQDYPVGFVRWTEQRNFEAALQLMAEGSLRVDQLITHRFDVSRAPEAYDLVAGSEPSLGIVLEYPGTAEVAVPDQQQRIVVLSPTVSGPTKGVAGVIGAGSFGQAVLLPFVKKAGFQLRTIASSGGTSATIAAQRFGFERATSDVNTILDDPAIDTVFVLTRHDSHADLVVRALKAGKHVFVEKPLALTLDQVDAVQAAVEASGRRLLVGFNRRYAPMARRLREMLDRRAEPASLILTINAGVLPPGHWLNDRAAGGGRIVGEGCHFIDLARFLVGMPISRAHAMPDHRREGATITLEFADDSTAVVHYLASGSRAFPKERVEAFWEGRTVVLDNWRRLQTYDASAPKWSSKSRQDKGHDAEIAGWANAVRQEGGPNVIDEILEVSRHAILLQNQVNE